MGRPREEQRRTGEKREKEPGSNRRKTGSKYETHVKKSARTGKHHERTKKGAG